MLDYLVKFNALPQYLKDKMSEPSILASVKELEERYDISLAAVVMKVMVKDISILDLAQYFVFEYKLDGRKAEQLVEEMKEKILFVSADYLGFETKTKRDLIGIEQKPGQVVNKVKTSNFFFSSEDEEEVSQLTQKLGPKDKVKEINEEKIASLINDVIFETGVSFSSSDLSERFVKVLKTYARTIRNRIDTKITLTKDVDKGGLGMRNGRADEVLKSLDKRNKKNESSLPEIKFKEDQLDAGEPKKPLEEKKPDLEAFRKKLDKNHSEGSRDMDYDLSSMPKKTPEKTIPKVSLGSGELKIDSKGFDFPVPTPKPKISVKQNIDGNLGDHIAGKDGKFKQRTSSLDTGRKKIEDVKVVPRLSGPIEELRNMNVVDFRRLDIDPMRAAAKIKEKIDLLEEDGLRKKLEGIRAWRESKINMEYIDIGRKSIGQKKPINDIIHDKNLSGHETLREEEFEAIINLNKELRF